MSPGSSRTGRWGTSTSGRRSPPAAPTPTSRGGPSTGSRTGSATRWPASTRPAAAATSASRRSSWSRPTASPVLHLADRGHRIHPRQARHSTRAAGHVRRGRRARRARVEVLLVDAAERHRGRTPLHDLRRPPGRSSAARRSATAGPPPVRVTARDERQPRPARRRLAMLSRSTGPGRGSATSWLAAARARPPVGRQRAGSIVRPAQPVHRRSAARPRPRSTARRSASASSTPATSGPRRRSIVRARRGYGSASSRTASPGPSRPGRASATPEAVLVWTPAPASATCRRAYHRLFRERLARGPWRDRPRPVLLNSWEGVYFDFDEDTPRRDGGGRTRPRRRAVRPRRRLVRRAGRRHAARSATGSSTAASCPGGLAGLSRRRVRDLGLDFGLWIEPEMVNPRSRLFEAHPDWAIGVPGRPRTESRQQLVLDLSRPEVVDHLSGMLHRRAVASAPSRTSSGT